MPSCLLPIFYRLTPFPIHSFYLPPGTYLPLLLPHHKQPTTMSEHQYKFNISMSCGGCSGAVERVLKRLEGMLARLPWLTLSMFCNIPTDCYSGVKSFEVSLESQSATVVTEPSVTYDTILSTIKKTGKTVNSGEADGQPTSV